MDGENVLNRQ